MNGSTPDRRQPPATTRTVVARKNNFRALPRGTDLTDARSDAASNPCNSTALGVSRQSDVTVLILAREIVSGRGREESCGLRESGLRKADPAAHMEAGVHEQDLPRHAARRRTKKEQRRIGHLGKLGVAPQRCAIAVDVQDVRETRDAGGRERL